MIIDRRGLFLPERERTNYRRSGCDYDLREQPITRSEMYLAIEEEFRRMGHLERRYNEASPAEVMAELLGYPEESWEEQQFYESMFIIREGPAQRPKESWHSMGFAVPYKSVCDFRSPKQPQQIIFSPERKPLSVLMRPYLEGVFKSGVPNGRKLQKSKIARFGHLDEVGVKNFSRALNNKDKRRAKEEYAFICAMYFGLSPFEARLIFHTCEETDELEGYPYIGGALYLFLEDKCYDYDQFVDVACQALIAADYELPDVFADNKYWVDRYRYMDDHIDKWMNK